MHKIEHAAILLLTCCTTLCAQPQIACDQPEFNFGSKPDSTMITHTFEIRNIGDAPLNISRVKASCGCTAVQTSDETIAPGAAATIKARFNPRGRRGRQRKSILVESNDPVQPRLRLWMSGEIIVEVALEPRYLNFRQIHKNRAATQHVELVSLKPDVRITDVTSYTPSYQATIDPDGRGLVVRTVPPLEEGLVRGRIEVTTDHPGHLTADLNIAGVAVDDLIALPRELILRQSAPHAHRLALVIRPLGTQTFRVTKVEVPHPSITPHVRMEQDGTARIELEGVRPDMDLTDAAIVIHTDLESTPLLRVPVRVIP